MDIKNRFQNFLARIAGDESAVEMTPENELEYWLSKIAERLNGGGNDPGDLN